MSSATSIKPPSDDLPRGSARRPDPAGGGKSASEDASAGAPEGRDTFRPWHFFVLVSLISATVAVVMARQARPEHLVLISLTVGAAGFAAGALYRTLLALVSAEEPRGSDEPMTAGMRAVLEREKMLTLRSIKELEFDRAMGKVSPADFDEMASRLRARAMSLIKQLDAGGEAYRELIEREVQSRVAKQAAGRVRRAPAWHGAASGPPCVCGTVNDQDAAFCKRCGAKLGGASAS